MTYTRVESECSFLRPLLCVELTIVALGRGVKCSISHYDVRVQRVICTDFLNLVRDGDLWHLAKGRNPVST